MRADSHLSKAWHAAGPAPADEMSAPNPWHPMTDAVDLKHLGKLIEELGEAVAAASRCVIQGIDEAEPVTGKINRQWLQDELADVRASIALVENRFNLDPDAMAKRVLRKVKHLRQWHELA